MLRAVGGEDPCGDTSGSTSTPLDSFRRGRAPPNPEHDKSGSGKRTVVEQGSPSFSTEQKSIKCTSVDNSIAKVQDVPEAVPQRKRSSSRLSPRVINQDCSPKKRQYAEDQGRTDARDSERAHALRADPSSTSVRSHSFSRLQETRPGGPSRRYSEQKLAVQMTQIANNDDIEVSMNAHQDPNQSVVASKHHQTPSATGAQAGRAKALLNLAGHSKMHFSNGDLLSDTSALLHQIDILEILEHDERPTFILDLTERSNFEPGPINVLYANSALRAMSQVYDRIRGLDVQESPAWTASGAFSDFKAWATSYVKDHAAMDVTLPSFSYANYTWAGTTLRRRLRLFRALIGSGHMPLAMSNLSAVKALTPTREHGSDIAGDRREDAQDYFGSACTTKQLPSVSKVSMLKSNASSSNLVSGPNVHAVHDASAIPLPDTAPLTPIEMPSDQVLDVAQYSAGSSLYIPTTSADNFFDWTRLPDSPSLPPHIKFARSIDWASTPLGPMESWSTELRSMCNLIMASPHPAAMYWGRHYVAIYNEAYILLAGSKHPELMGQSYRDAWPEIWDSIEIVFENAWSLGESTMKDDDCLFISRSAGPNLEETYFSWSVIPLVGSSGCVVGLYNPAFEKTRRKVAERRMFTLRELGEMTAAARDLKSFWGKVIEALRYNEMDAPFVLVYSCSDDQDNESQCSTRSGTNSAPKSCVLEGSIGIPDGHPAFASHFDLRNDSDYFAKVFCKAVKEERPLYLSVEDGTLDPELLADITWRGFGDPCNAVVCFPVHLQGGEATIGFVVMGVNPRRPYDDDYSLYVQLLNRQLATAMASVVLFEDEIRRSERAAKIAAQEQSQLSERLKVKTQQVQESEIKFARMAELSPVGMFIADATGRITYCNDKWYEIADRPKGLTKSQDWMDAIDDEYRAQLESLWKNLVEKAVPFSTELRFKRAWVDQQGTKGETWVLASASPDIGPAGAGQGMIFGSITDISQQKWAEHVQTQRRQEAMEMKRQQENFIDITSHEMRNPLSAMLQCADEIKTSLIDLKGAGTADAQSESVLKNAIDASLTIELCAQHQKRIVDDILTMSKMDSALLLVTPCPTRPKSIVTRALKMFDNELTTNDIKMKFQLDESFDNCHIDWVNMDPSRVLQVLINLTTNSIKFTSGQSKRLINITLGASTQRPTAHNDVQFFKKRPVSPAKRSTHDLGTGEEVFIHFAVQDTGRGLTEGEMQMLFQRFSQATPRTHITYGGSGLGLFISRELVEMQGGEIGVASTAGQGSTFAFYIRAKRTDAPVDGSEDIKDTPALPGHPGVPFHAVSSELTALQHPSQPAQESIVSASDPSRSAPPTVDGKRTTASDVSSTKTSRPLHVLIVEDNLVNQKVLARQLRNSGATVTVANHGAEGIACLRTSTFWHHDRASVPGPDRVEIDVVLLDVEMPVMNGLVAASTIREHQKSSDVVAHVPVIAVTANARSEQIETALRAGMDDVVSKPFTIRELQPKMQELVERYPRPQ